MAEQLKDKELQQYHEDMQDVFSRPGWKRIEEKMTELLQEADSLDGIDSLEKLHFRRGQVAAFSWMLAQPVMHETVYNDLLESEDDQ